MLEARADAVQGGNKGGPNSAGCASKFAGGGNGGAVNVRVNQDCSLRRQAEEVLAINPNNPDNLVVGQNDSVIGFNHCGYDFSFDGGKTWGSQIPPFWQFILADGHTADACSDPTATFDADGNVYVGGVLFDIASAASAFVVMKSNKEIGGAFYHTPAPLSFQTYRTDPAGVVASDNNPDIFHDKEFIVADANSGSPKRNNVYATWTRFATTGVGVGANSPIYFSQSVNGGATWSPGIEISGVNAAVCTVFSGSANPNACDQDQGSHPIVGPDGTIYVAFGNGNTPDFGINQVLFVKCPAGANCAERGQLVLTGQGRRPHRDPSLRPRSGDRLPSGSPMPAAERLSGPGVHVDHGLGRLEQRPVRQLVGRTESGFELQPARLGRDGHAAV